MKPQPNSFQSIAPISPLETLCLTFHRSDGSIDGVIRPTEENSVNAPDVKITVKCFLSLFLQFDILLKYSLDEALGTRVSAADIGYPVINFGPVYLPTSSSGLVLARNVFSAVCNSA